MHADVYPFSISPHRTTSPLAPPPVAAGVTGATPRSEKRRPGKGSGLSRPLPPRRPGSDGLQAQPRKLDGKGAAGDPHEKILKKNLSPDSLEPPTIFSIFRKTGGEQVRDLDW